MAGVDNYKVKMDSMAGQDTQLVGKTLMKAVNTYNKSFHAKHTICKVQINSLDNSFKGGVKIHLSMRNCLSLRSTLNLGKNGSLKTRLKTKFQFKPKAAEILQVSNLTTVQNVIAHIVDQFRIQESPLQFALYEKTLTGQSKGESTHRRMSLDEKPLVLSLLWCTQGLQKRKRLVLCDHDPDNARAEYDNKSAKELQALLDQLDEEEASEVRAIHAKYSQLLELYKGALDSKRAEMKGSCPDIYRRRERGAPVLQRSTSLADQDVDTIMKASKSKTGCSLQ